jgi:hypothetical protein
MTQSDLTLKAWLITFHLLTERGKSILTSVTKRWHLSKPTDLVQEPAN